MTDLESMEVRLERIIQRYQRRYGISHADLSWVLLRMGTNYYFKDICSRHIKDSLDAAPSVEQAAIA